MNDQAQSTQTLRSAALGLLLTLALAVPLAPTAQATSCTFPPTESGGGNCSFVCELNYLHVTITSTDDNAEVSIAAECKASENPSDPEDGVPPWEASCTLDRTCNGDGPTVHDATGRCVADIDEWNNDVWEGACVNDNDADADADVLIDELVALLCDGSLVIDCDVGAQLGAIPACTLTPGAMRLCLLGLRASRDGGSAVVLSGQPGVAEAAVCASGACWSVLPTVLPRLDGGATVGVGP